MQKKAWILISFLSFFLTQAVSAEEKLPECPPGMMLVYLDTNTPPSITEKPPTLSREIKIKSFGCKRMFRYKKKLYPTDSYHRLDGEGLRPVIKDTPKAVTSLNRYQNNLSGANTAAYVGTIGLALAIGSLFISPDTNQTLRSIGLITGSSLFAGSFIITFGVLRTNESNLSDAVNHYNAAHPKEPLKLQFSTGILF